MLNSEPHILPLYEIEEARAPRLSCSDLEIIIRIFTVFATPFSGMRKPEEIRPEEPLTSFGSPLKTHFYRLVFK